MKTAPFVLASQHVPNKRQSKKLKGALSDSDDDYEREWVLSRASDVRYPVNADGHKA